MAARNRGSPDPEAIVRFDATRLGLPDYRGTRLRRVQRRQPQAVTLFNAERVPVSLGIALYTSIMSGERIRAAQSALDRFLYELLGADDEISLYRCVLSLDCDHERPTLLRAWPAR